MLFHQTKQPIELKITHLNKAQDKRQQELLAAMNDQHGLKQLKKSLTRQKGSQRQQQG